MKRLITLILLVAACSSFAGVTPENRPAITTPPASLKLDPFYKKYLNANGIHITASYRVPDEAMWAAHRTLTFLTNNLPAKVLKAMTDINTRVTVMARYEGTTDVPEHAHLAADTSLNWDVRARGLGGTPDMPMSSCAEENILCYQIDKYHAEDILIHEFAHSIHLIGITITDPAFNDRLRASLEAAKAAGKWENTYAGSNIEEYWAEGVQNWFNVNAEVEAPDGKHGRINSRADLKSYDDGLYQILKTYFPETEESASCHICSDIFH